jgi:hypothetical protein
MRPEALPIWVEIVGRDTQITSTGRGLEQSGDPREGEARLGHEDSPKGSAGPYPATAVDGRVRRMQCILSIAKPDEVERFSQPQAKVTHTIFQTGGEIRAKQGDTLRTEQSQRTFRVVQFHNHGEMNIFTTYYCEERSDRP